MQSTIKQGNKTNGVINGGYGSINGLKPRIPSTGTQNTKGYVSPDDYATVRSHKIERSSSNPAVRNELSVSVLFCLQLKIMMSTIMTVIKYNFLNK